VHLRRRADRVNLIRRRLVDFLVLARDEGNDAVVRQRILDQPDATLLADGKRQPHHRVDDDATQRQHRQIIGDDRVVGALGGQCLFAELFRFVEDFVLVFVVPIVHFKIHQVVIHAMWPVQSRVYYTGTDAAVTTFRPWRQN